MKVSAKPERSSLHGSFASRLLRWYDREGRDLPWRKTRDPYRIWVSEIMLQQTGVETVIPYYQRFLSRFPDLAALADSHLDEVIASWAGLGYYARARNLHAAAVMIQNRLGGRFPDDFETLTMLPGVGRSTAGAILAIAFNRRFPILDGNVRRILCRVFAIGEDPRRPAVAKRLWQWSEELMSGDRSHDYTQAIMDLGAILCTPRRPKCGRCPVAACCQARLKGKAEDYPVRSPKGPMRLRREVVLILLFENRCLLRKRAHGGLLGGLWEFPGCTLEGEEKGEDAARRLLADLGTDGETKKRGKNRHTYSHFRLESEFFTVALRSRPKSGGHDACAWVPVKELGSLPLHGAHKKILGLCEDLKP